MLEKLHALQERMEQLEDRIAVQDRIWSALIFSDLGDWANATACYTDDAIVDLKNYNPPFSAHPAALPILEFRKIASAFMPGFEVRQHLVTNFDISVKGDKAISHSQVRAIHVLEGSVWEAHATYQHGLCRMGKEWKISYLCGTLIHQTGEELIEAARLKVCGG